MSIRGIISNISIRLRNIGAVNAKAYANVDAAAYEQYEGLRANNVDRVLIIPGFMAPIVLIYDNKTKSYRLA